MVEELALVLILHHLVQCRQAYWRDSVQIRYLLQDSRVDGFLNLFMKLKDELALEVAVALELVPLAWAGGGADTAHGRAQLGAYRVRTSSQWFMKWELWLVDSSSSWAGFSFPSQGSPPWVWRLLHWPPHVLGPVPFEDECLTHLVLSSISTYTKTRILRLCCYEELHGDGGVVMLNKKWMHVSIYNSC